MVGQFRLIVMKATILTKVFYFFEIRKGFFGYCKNKLFNKEGVLS